MTFGIGRREFITLLGGAAVTWPLATRAQQPARVFRVGLLLPASTDIAAPYIDAFRQGLRERGYVEGQNITFEYRMIDGSPARASEAAIDLTRLKVDVILAWTTTMATAAQRATTIIPIVMHWIADVDNSSVNRINLRIANALTHLTCAALAIGRPPFRFNLGVRSAA
jgi:putative ABC transport system substrate-binding protein